MVANSEEFNRLVSPEREMELRVLLGEQALLLERSDSRERDLARFYTLANIEEQRKLRNLGRPMLDSNEIKTSEELIEALNITRFTTTDSDLVPGNPLTEENPTHVALASLCEAATSENHGGFSIDLLIDASTVLLEEVKTKHARANTPRKGIFELFRKQINLNAINEELAEANMLDNMIKATASAS